MHSVYISKNTDSNVLLISTWRLSPAPSPFPGILPSHWAEIRLRKTIVTVWWSWQRRPEVIKMVLSHYFKQTERAPTRGIKEREEIWQGSMGCSPKEVTIFYKRNHPAGMKPINNSETSEQEYTHISYLRDMRAFSSAVLKTCCRILKASPSLCLVLQLCHYPQGQSLQHKICPKLVLKPCPGLTLSSPQETEFIPKSHTNSRWQRTAGASWNPDELRKLLVQHVGSLKMATWLCSNSLYMWSKKCWMIPDSTEKE